jgi:D-alanine--D-alanine ligase
LTEFPQSLSAADFVFLTDIYPAREAPRPGVSSARIGELLQPPYQYVPSRHRLPSEVAGFLRADDVVVIMGAGNIAELAPLLNATWEDRTALNAGRRALRVAVLQGGDSSEREVSLHSSRAAAAALRSLGHEVATFDATELLLGAGSLKPLVDYRPDVAFLGVHGRRGEDGALQGLLELLHIPYTGSGILASARAMDKDAAKAVLARHGIAVPRGVLITQPEAPIEVPGPWVVKPNEEGSTIGLSFVETESDLAEAIRLALRFGRQVLVEEWLRGMEISVPVLVDRALPAIEIVPDGGRYDFARKYLPGATEEIVPARLPEETLRAAEDVALRCHQALGCRGATRTDMMVVPEPDGTYAPSGLRVLEVNTLPGLTETSLLPRSAQAAGIGFAELCQEILNDALAQA